MNVTSHFDFRNVVIQHEQTLTLMVRVKAPPAPQTTGRKPLNLALVLDRSGSMSGLKIDYLRQAASELVKNLTAQDRLAVVIFDDEIQTIVSPQAVTDKDAIGQRIRSIEPRGMTNLSGGWMEGLGHLEAGFDKEAINRVLLLTDGMANEGVTDPERLRAIGLQARDKGITTTTLGFGADFEEELLGELADQSGGAFYFIETPDAAPAAFAEELGELLSVVGQNLTVELRARPPAQFLSVLNKYPTEAIENGLRIRAGDLFGDEQREIIAELFVPGLAEMGPRQVGDIVVTFDQVVDPIRHHRIELPVEINIVTPEQAPEKPDHEVAEPASLLRFSDLRDRVLGLIKDGESKQARELIDEARKDLGHKGLLTLELRKEFDILYRELGASEEDYDLGTKAMYYTTHRQRRGKGDYRK